MKTRNTPGVTELRETPTGGSQQRMVRRWLCYECGCTYRHSVTRHQTEPRIIVDGWQAQYVKLPSTRQRRCSDCGEVKRHGYREVKSPNVRVSESGGENPKP